MATVSRVEYLGGPWEGAEMPPYSLSLSVDIRALRVLHDDGRVGIYERVGEGEPFVFIWQGWQ